MSEERPLTFGRWFWAGVLLTAGKLWLVSGQPICALATGGQDDRRFLQLAGHLLRGEWLGPAGAPALAHGPLYSCWIAVVAWLGLPLLLAQQLLYAAACAALVRACRPALASGVAGFWLYALLLCNPMTYDGSSMSRVLPQQVGGALVILVFAGVAALSLRRREPLRRLLPWAVLLGLSGGGFWLNGGSRCWILPGVALLAGTTLGGAWRASREEFSRLARGFGVAVLLAVLPVVVVSGMNSGHYGKLATVEARTTPAETAPGAAPFLTAADYVVSFRNFVAFAPPSVGTGPELEIFRQLTHEKLAPGPGTTAMPAPTEGEKRRVEKLQWIGKLLRPVLLGLFYLALVLAPIRAIQLFKLRRGSFPLTLAASAWLAGAVGIFFLSRGLTPPGPGLTIATFAPIYPLLLVFIGTVTWDAAAVWVAPRLPQRKRKPAHDRPALAGPLLYHVLLAFLWLAGRAVAVLTMIRRVNYSQLVRNSLASPRAVRAWFWAGVALTVFKLWLTRSQPVYAISSAAHDDRLFLQLAESLVRGEWLGAYSQMTLAKGPFYSIWIALMFWAGIPLGLGVQLAYAGACAFFTRACRPAIRPGAALFAIYALLLWNPMTYEAPTMGRIIRQQIYTPLGLAIFAGMVALYCRRQETLRRQLPWAIGLGLAGGCFWLTREESVWLVPSVVLLAGAALIAAWRASRAHGRTMLQALGVAAVCAALPVGFVSWQNYRHYGWFGTVEFRAPEFRDAYGAMVRVKVGPALDYVPVTRQSREAMYAVSPAFAKLQPYFEGAYGTGWAGASTSRTQLPPEERQIGSGWLMWALRDCVAAAGYCHNAREALDFYRRMADEINAACDQGRLPAHPWRSSFLPIWQDGETAAIARTTFRFADYVVSWDAFDVLPPLSLGDHDDLLLFHDLTRDAVSSSVRAPAMPLRNQEPFNQRKFQMLHVIGNRLRPVLTVLLLVAQLVALVRLGQSIRSRQCPFGLVLAAAAWGGAFAYLVLNAMVDVTSFSVTAVSTFSPIYPLLLVFIVAVAWDAADAWWRTPPEPGRT